MVGGSSPCLVWSRDAMPTAEQGRGREVVVAVTDDRLDLIDSCNDVEEGGVAGNLP